MPRLFTYTIPIDDGAAPNPFNGMCSLAICKPGIRRVAERGDWVVGLGSKHAPGGDRSGQLVYAMRVEEVVTMQEYDQYALERWPFRIPKVESSDLKDRLGDCIYDFSGGVPRQRKGVHDAVNRETDLRGEKVLLSWDFYYLGNKAVPLPEHLMGICHQTQGHKSDSNAPFLQPFIDWIRSQGWVSAYLHGQPDFQIDWKDSDSRCKGCRVRREDAENDQEYE